MPAHGSLPWAGARNHTTAQHLVALGCWAPVCDNALWLGHCDVKAHDNRYGVIMFMKSCMSLEEPLSGSPLLCAIMFTKSMCMYENKLVPFVI